jgi:mono/diheme cytochrome c family protein
VLLRLFVVVMAATLLTGSAVSAADAPSGLGEFDEAIRPFLQQHCVSCHGEKKQKGDLRVDMLVPDFVNPVTAGHWTEIMDRINSGEMPPKKEARPEARSVARVAEWIAAQLTEAESARQAATGEKVSYRRLSREEYRNTIRDLLGVTYDASDPSGLPEDPDWQGIERIGAVLTLSPAHVEKYLLAAETVLNEALAIGPRPKSQIVRWTAAKMRVGGGIYEQLAAKGLLDQVRADIVPNNGALDARDLKVETTGEYIVRVKLSGLRPANGRAARLRLYATDISRTLFEQDVEAAEDAPVTLEFRTHLPAGTHLIRIVNAVPGPNPEERASRPLGTKPFFTMKARQPWQIKLTDEDFKPIWPTILLDWIEWEGPTPESWPPPAHEAIFFKGNSAVPDTAYAREILSRFATRAYRRPVRPEELERLVKLFEGAEAIGDNFTNSIKTALLAVLCSNNFLYLVEGSTAAPSPKLTDWELASRISYFLWSTIPDDRLLDLARQGTLHRPEVLRDEVHRMLGDPKAMAFATSFPRQWLQLRRVGMFEPDKKIYPEYDEYLEKSMVAETTAFFGEVLRQHLGLREFLASDWTMLNERLAGHYGIQDVKGEAFRRVALKPEYHRGGLLTQASILSLTSDGTRHRPVHRGKWVLESMFGNPPPPPPPNVSALKPTPQNQPKTSLRAKIEAHRDDANCAACHRKIDPLGLAFENYDAIGHWRLQEAVREGSGADPRIDPSGELPDGRRFADAVELKALLVADVDKFNAAFTKKLATYALRRGMTFDDRTALAGIAAQSKEHDFELDTLIESLVLSDLFQKR